MTPDFTLRYEATIVNAARSWRKTDTSTDWAEEGAQKRTHAHTSTDLRYGHRESKIGKGQSLQYVVLGKLDTHMLSNEIRPLSCTRHKN